MINYSVRPSAWPHTATIDNQKNCEGCFEVKTKTTTNLASGGIKIDSMCTWMMPRCGCPPCRIYCGSKLTYAGVIYTVSEEMPADDPAECTKWILEKACASC